MKSVDAIITDVAVALVKAGAPAELTVAHIRIAVEAGVRFGRTAPLDPDQVKQVVDRVANSECKCDSLIPCAHHAAWELQKAMSL